MHNTTIISLFTFRGFHLPKIPPPKKERLTKTTHTRKYRLSKKNPKKLAMVLKMDLGKYEQQIRVFAPQKTQISNLEIPKEHNPNLISFNIGDCKLAYYLDGKKGFVYDKLGMFLGAFEKHDLINLYHKIGAFLKTQKSEKG
jgi:hypothetical protein